MLSYSVSRNVVGTSDPRTTNVPQAKGCPAFFATSYSRTLARFMHTARPKIRRRNAKKVPRRRKKTFRSFLSLSLANGHRAQPPSNIACHGVTFSFVHSISATPEKFSKNTVYGTVHSRKKLIATFASTAHVTPELPFRAGKVLRVTSDRTLSRTRHVRCYRLPTLLPKTVSTYTPVKALQKISPLFARRSNEQLLHRNTVVAQTRPNRTAAQGGWNSRTVTSRDFAVIPQCPAGFGAPQRALQ